MAGGDYHLVYVIEAPKAVIISFNCTSHGAEDGIQANCSCQTSPDAI